MWRTDEGTPRWQRSRLGILQTDARIELEPGGHLRRLPGQGSRYAGFQTSLEEIPTPVGHDRGRVDRRARVSDIGPG